jgi:hypothetical protein
MKSRRRNSHASKPVGLPGSRRKARGGAYLLGRKLAYVDLSLFQIVEGLRYAFPKAMRRLEKKIPRVVALHDRVANRPRAPKRQRHGAETALHGWGVRTRTAESVGIEIRRCCRGKFWRCGRNGGAETVRV